MIGFLMPATLPAASYTFNIEQTLVGSTGGLDHHMAYAWKISGFNLGTETITSAKLTFTNFANWDNNSNKLFVYIGATARGGTGGASTILPGNYAGSTAGFTQTPTYYQDSADGTTINDAFSGTAATPLYDVNVPSLTTKSTACG